ncbi:hypothetical protein [Megamonas funiformis]|uniref:hypothetical protein n=1 Tax=Megamonas funiformis TaxID=437897 RepID=UPI0024AE7F53|nr:hypothetical protein [Megamonas funiformis]
MNSKIYLIPVIVFGMFLSIILGLQSQWGDITVISSVIVLFLSVLVLGYVLNEFFQRYNKKEVLQQRYYDEYIKSLDSIKLENIKIVERLDDDIKQYLGKNNECINELLDIVKLLSNVIQEMNNEMILLNKKVDNEFIKIKNIARILEEIEDNLDEKEIIVKNIMDEIIKLNGKIDNEYTKIKGIGRTLDDVYEEIEDMNMVDFVTFIKESKKFVEELDGKLKKEREQNIEIVQQALAQYQNVCDDFIRQSTRLNTEDIKLLKKISGELK